MGIVGAMQQRVAITQDLVLVGGGHAHVHVAEELRHAAGARGARDARYPRGRDALFGHAAGLRRRALFARRMPHRSRPARAVCRRAADPRRSDRARPGRLRIVVRCPSADPIRCSVDRYRLGPPLRRCPRRRRARNRGQADRPVRGALGGVAGAGARDAAAAPRRGRRRRRRGRARAFGATSPGRTEGRRGRGNPGHPRGVAAVAQCPGPPAVRADPRRSPGDRARRQRRRACRAGCSALRRWQAGRIRRGAVGDPGRCRALARRHRPAADAGGLHRGRRQAALARRPEDLRGRRRRDDARPSAREGGSLRRPAGSAARRQSAPRARRAAATTGRAAKARAGADRHRRRAGRRVARAARGVWPAAVAVQGVDRPSLDAALPRIAGDAARAGRRPDALRRLRGEGPGGGAQPGHGAAPSGDERRGDDRSRQPGRCGADLVPWCAAAAADRRFLSRDGRRPVSVRQDCCDPCARRHLRDGRNAGERTGDRDPAAGAPADRRARPFSHAARWPRRAGAGRRRADRRAQRRGRRTRSRICRDRTAAARKAAAQGWAALSAIGWS